MSEPHDIPTLERRQLLQGLAAASLCPLAMVPVINGVGAAEDSPETVAFVANALTEVVRNRHGKYLLPAQMTDVRKGIFRNQRIAEALKQVKLKNSDEPAVIFLAD